MSTEKTIVSILKEYLDQAQAIISQYGPTVWESTLSLIRIDGIFELSITLLFLISACVLALNFKKLHAAAMRADEYDSATGAIAVATYLLTGILAIFGIARTLCSFPTILKVFSPELYLLYAAAQKIGLL